MLKIQEVEKKWTDMVKGQIWKSTKSKYWFVCAKHGKYFQKYYNHDTGYGCRKCRTDRVKETHSLTIEEAEKRFSEMVKGQKWTRAIDKYWFLCSIHGRYLQSFNCHDNGAGCRECKGGISLTIQKAEERFLDLVRDQKWINAWAKYWFLCSIHGKYLQQFSAHTNGSRCPICKGSTGEKNLKTVVKVLGILDYETEKTFPDCRDINPLFFDGASESRKVLFEYNGEQHYKPIKFFGGQKKFESTLRRDKIKRDWAKRNGWKLIVVPYRIKNIESYIRSRIAA